MTLWKRTPSCICHHPHKFGDHRHGVPPLRMGGHFSKESILWEGQTLGKFMEGGVFYMGNNDQIISSRREGFTNVFFSYLKIYPNYGGIYTR